MLAGDFLALARQLAQLLSTLTLAHAGDQVARLAQALRRAAGLRFTLRRSRRLRGSGVLHVFGGLLQPFDGLIELLLTRALRLLSHALPHRLQLLLHLGLLGLLPALLSLLPLLAALLALLPRLPLLALLTRLALLSLLALLPLLLLLLGPIARELLH